MQAIIMMGIPGSGKSTWVKNNAGPYAEVDSADLYHTYDGVHKYDSSKAGWAHANCLLDFKDDLHAMGKVPVVVCDNTNCTMAEIAPYVALAMAYRELRGCKVRIVNTDCNVDLAVQRNQHGVPMKVILQRYDSLCKLRQEWPAFWPKIEIVQTDGAF